MMQSRVVVCAALLAVLAACSSEPEPEAQAPVAPPPPPVAAKPAAPEDPVAKMARAVGNGKPGAAVDIKYEFQSKPQIGKPVAVEVVLIPNAGVDSMEATFGGMDGITLAGPLTASFPQVKEGESYKHNFSLLADRNGVFYITVAVNTQISGASLGRTFSIPFVVGTAPAQEKAAAPPAKDATGQAVQPMKAQETTG